MHGSTATTSTTELGKSKLEDQRLTATAEGHATSQLRAIGLSSRGLESSYMQAGYVAAFAENHNQRTHLYEEGAAVLPSYITGALSLSLYIYMCVYIMNELTNKSIRRSGNL